MNIEALYQDILEQLKEGKRPMLELSQNEIDTLVQEWERRCHSPENLRPLLAIFDHCRKEHQEFQALLIKTLQSVQDSETLIFTLSAFQKHVIEFYQKRGLRFPMKILESFKTLLQHQNFEVLEWTLRTIEQLGPQGIVLKESLIMRKPGFLQGLRPQQKIIKQLIEIIFQNWGLNANGRR